MSKTLQEQLETVAELRHSESLWKEEKRKAFEQWTANNEGLLTTLSGITTRLQEAETALRQAALKAYAQDGNKAPIAGVIIKEFETLAYDPAEALAWASYHSMALQLDVRAFEKIAKASPLAFVSYHGEARAQIATDLSKFVDTPINIGAYIDQGT